MEIYIGIFHPLKENNALNVLGLISEKHKVLTLDHVSSRDS